MHSFFHELSLVPKQFYNDKNYVFSVFKVEFFDFSDDFPEQLPFVVGLRSHFVQVFLAQHHLLIRPHEDGDHPVAVLLELLRLLRVLLGGGRAVRGSIEQGSGRVKETGHVLLRRLLHLTESQLFHF